MSRRYPPAVGRLGVERDCQAPVRHSGRPALGLVDHEVAVHGDVGDSRADAHRQAQCGGCTKWLSITSCNQSDPATAAISSARRREVRGRMDGAMRVPAMALTLLLPDFAPPRTSHPYRAGAATANVRPGADIVGGANSGRVSSAVTGCRRMASSDHTTVSQAEQVAAERTTPPWRVSLIAPAALSVSPARARLRLAPPPRLRARRRSAPRPVHGASTRTPPKPGSRPDSRPSTRWASTSSPGVFCSTSSRGARPA